MSSIVQVLITKLSTGEEFEGIAYRDGGNYEAVWHEGGLRLVFNFDESGEQVSMNNYRLRRADTP
jgi:hypothetical protein